MRAPSMLPAAAVGLALLAAPGAAEARKFARGLYAEAGAGATAFLGDAGQNAAIGPSFGIRGGYDLFSWFSVGGAVLATTHEATVPPPPEQEYFQLYAGGGDARLQLRLGPVGVFAEGAAGLAMISTNVLDRVGVTEPGSRLGPWFQAGGGLDYHTRNRHFSVGVAGDWSLFPDFDAAQAVTARLYLRYTL